MTKIEIQVRLNFSPKCLKQPQKAILNYFLAEMTQNVDQNWNSSRLNFGPKCLKQPQKAKNPESGSWSGSPSHFLEGI